MPPIQSNSNPKVNLLKYPWLMCPGNENSTYNFYDPTSNVSYSVNIPELKQWKICCSKEGWLLVSQGTRMCFFQPFTGKTIELPGLSLADKIDAITFSASPTSSCCKIFGISQASHGKSFVFYLRSRDENWTHEEFHSKPFVPIPNTLVYWNWTEKFYCLTQDGTLAVFSLTGNEMKSCLHRKSASADFCKRTYCHFLVPSGKCLLQVCVGEARKSFRILRLTSSMEWKRTNLNNSALFCSQTSSLAVQEAKGTLKNTVQLSMFHNSNNSSNISYPVMKGNYSSKYLYNTTQLLRGTWIQPILNWNFIEFRLGKVCQTSSLAVQEARVH